MHWLGVVLLIVIGAAFASGVWAVLRRKWYGLAPAMTVGLAAALAGPTGLNYFYRTVGLLAQAPPLHLAITWLLSSAAALVVWIALWAGYSRGYWFWRLAALTGVLSLLALIEANEPILLCLSTMPVVAAGAWLLRWRQDHRLDAGAPANKNARLRWSLRDALLAFVAVGLGAVALRSVAAAELYLVRSDFAVTWATLTALALTAACGGLARRVGVRWAFALAALCLAIGGALWHWSRDAFGLAYYFNIDPYVRPENKIALLAFGAVGATAALLVLGNLYAAATHTDRPVARRTARALLALVLAAIAAPLIPAYPRMLPPAAGVTPLPPSAAYARIQAAGEKATKLKSPGFKTAPVVKEAAAALAEPGNVWFETRRFRENELSLSYDLSFDRDVMLARALDAHAAQAEAAGRVSECLDLAILQFRLGRVLRRGGIFMNWYVGCAIAERYGCATVSGVLDQLSDDECRRALAELRLSLADRPDVETVLAYDAYWSRTCFGWRHALYRAALRLLGEEPNPTITWHMTKEQTEAMDRHSLLRLRLMEARLAVEIFRREHRQWPERWDDLIPQHLSAAPMDPYTGEPLVHRRHGETFLLYSVGPDRQDNGGRFQYDPQDLRLEGFARDIKIEGFDVDWDRDRRIQVNSWPRKKAP